MKMCCETLGTYSFIANILYTKEQEAVTGLRIRLCKDNAIIPRLLETCAWRVEGEDWRHSLGYTCQWRQQQAPGLLLCGQNAWRSAGPYYAHIYMYISCNCANITNNAYFVYVQEDDKQSGEGSYVCHCCYAKEGDFLSEVRFALNSVESRRRPHNLGYDAFPWEMIVHGNCWEYRRYSKLAVLPDKVSRYLFEFDSQNYTSLNLPAIPDDEPNIQCLMTPEQIQYTLHIMCV